MGVTEDGWSGHLAFGPWWLLYSGPIGQTDQHAHHAFQIVVHNGGPCVADHHQHELPGPVVVIDPDQDHAFIDRRDHALVAFVNPESNAGAALRDREVVRTEAADGRLVSSIVDTLRPENWSRAEEMIRRILAAVCDSSIDRPSAAILNFTSMTGTRFMQTAIFNVVLREVKTDHPGDERDWL